jgi:hypothetical protein
MNRYDGDAAESAFRNAFDADRCKITYKRNFSANRKRKTTPNGGRSHPSGSIKQAASRPQRRNRFA